MMKNATRGLALLLTLAACKLGAVCMPVNWRLAPTEVAYILTHGEARFIMADAAAPTIVPGSWIGD